MNDLLDMNPIPRLRKSDCQEILHCLSRREGFRYRMLALIDETIEEASMMSLKKDLESGRIRDAIFDCLTGMGSEMLSYEEFSDYLYRKIGFLKRKRRIREDSPELSNVDFEVIEHDFGYTLIRTGEEQKIFNNIENVLEKGIEVAGCCHRLHNECIVLVRNAETSLIRYFSLKDGLSKGLWADNVGLPYQINPNEIIYPITINELSPNKMAYMSLSKGTPVTEWHHEVGPLEYGSYKDRVFKVTLFNGKQTYISIRYGYVPCGKWFLKVGPILGCPLLFRYFHARDVRGKDTMKEAYISLDNGYAIGDWYDRVSSPYLKKDGKICFKGYKDDGMEEEIEIPFHLEYRN